MRSYTLTQSEEGADYKVCYLFANISHFSEWLGGSNARTESYNNTVKEHRNLQQYQTQKAPAEFLALPGSRTERRKWLV